MDLGEGYGLLGVGLKPVIDEDEEGNRHLVILVTAAAGKVSNLVPMEPVEFVLGEFGRVPLGQVHGAIEGNLRAKREKAAQ